MMASYQVDYWLKLRNNESKTKNYLEASVVDISLGRFVPLFDSIDHFVRDLSLDTVSF